MTSTLLSRSVSISAFTVKTRPTPSASNDFYLWQVAHDTWAQSKPSEANWKLKPHFSSPVGFIESEMFRTLKVYLCNCAVERPEVCACMCVGLCFRGKSVQRSIPTAWSPKIWSELRLSVASDVFFMSLMCQRLNKRSNLSLYSKAALCKHFHLWFARECVVTLFTSQILLADTWKYNIEQAYSVEICVQNISPSNLQYL